MWLPQNVEQALFKWQKWRNSIINYWVESRSKLDEPSKFLESEVDQRIAELVLPDSRIFKLYWICCVFSDYNFDYPLTFKNIAMPTNLSVQNLGIKSGTRLYPPAVINEKDLKFEAVQLGLNRESLRDIYSQSYSRKMLIKSSHELLDMLRLIRGRPRKHGKRGPLPKYSDRLAVQCAALKDFSKISYVQIANKLCLPINKPFESWQSDIATHLVNRGRQLLKELSYE